MPAEPRACRPKAQPPDSPFIVIAPPLTTTGLFPAVEIKVPLVVMSALLVIAPTVNALGITVFPLLSSRVRVLCTVPVKGEPRYCLT